MQKRTEQKTNTSIYYIKNFIHRSRWHCSIQDRLCRDLLPHSILLLGTSRLRSRGHPVVNHNSEDVDHNLVGFFFRLPLVPIAIGRGKTGKEHWIFFINGKRTVIKVLYFYSNYWQ